MTDEYYMEQALEQAEMAFSAGEFPVGCVIADGVKICATGSRHGTKETNEIDHAEIVALRSLYAQKGLENPGRLTLYCTMEPCLMCFAAILLSGIRRIVYAYEDVMGGGTGVDLTTASPLYRNSRITVIPHVLRQESLMLFKKFFAQPENDYWKNSLLADYTLAQNTG